MSNLSDAIAAWLLVLTCLIFCTSCAPDQGISFVPEERNPLPKNRLKALADTSLYLDLISNLPSPREQVDSLLSAADWLKNYRERTALKYAQNALEIANQNRWNYSSGIANYYVALIKIIQDEWGEGADDGLVDAKISARLFADLEKPYWLAKAQNLIGIFFIKKGVKDSADFHLDKALVHLQQIEKTSASLNRLRGEIYHDWGNLYFQSDSGMEVISRTFERSDSLYRLSQHFAAQARMWTDLGIIYFDRGQYKKADSLYHKSLAYAIRVNDRPNTANAYKKIGYLNMIRFYLDPDHSISFADSAITTFLKSAKADNENRYDAYNFLGQTHGLINQFLPKHERHLDSSIIYFQKAMVGARKEGAFSLLPDMVTNITEVCALREAYSGQGCEDYLGQNVSVFLNQNYTSILDTISTNLQEANQRNQSFSRNQLEERNSRRRRING